MPELPTIQLNARTAAAAQKNSELYSLEP